MPIAPDNQTADTLAALLEGVASRDPAALKTLYDVTSSKLFGVALRILGKHEWAEEVLQDAYINIWRFAGDYQQTLSAPQTWMATIVRNRALDYLRRQNAAETGWIDELDELVPGNEPDPADRSQLSGEAQRLAGCIERLDATQRQAIALAYYRDQSHGEIADNLKAPLGTVKSWIRRGLERLRACLGEL